MRIKLLFLAMVFAFSGSAHSSIISGDLFTDGGSAVNLSGLEWLSFDDSALSTLGIGRKTIEDPTSAWSIAGWSIASFDQVNALFNSINLTSGSLASNSDGVAFILDNWGFGSLEDLTDLDADGAVVQENTRYINALYGAAGEKNSTTLIRSLSCGDTDDTNIHFGVGCIEPTRADVNLAAGQEFGTFLVRSSVVPVPAAAWLFVTALIGLIGFSKRKNTT